MSQDDVDNMQGLDEDQDEVSFGVDAQFLQVRDTMTVLLDDPCEFSKLGPLWWRSVAEVLEFAHKFGFSDTIEDVCRALLAKANQEDQLCADQMSRLAGMPKATWLPGMACACHVFRELREAKQAELGKQQKEAKQAQIGEQQEAKQEGGGGGAKQEEAKQEEAKQEEAKQEEAKQEGEEEAKQEEAKQEEAKHEGGGAKQEEAKHEGGGAKQEEAKQEGGGAKQEEAKHEGGVKQEDAELREEVAAMKAGLLPLPCCGRFQTRSKYLCGSSKVVASDFEKDVYVALTDNKLEIRLLSTNLIVGCYNDIKDPRCDNSGKVPIASGKAVVETAMSFVVADLDTFAIVCFAKPLGFADMCAGRPAGWACSGGFLTAVYERFDDDLGYLIYYGVQLDLATTTLRKVDLGLPIGVEIPKCVHVGYAAQAVYMLWMVYPRLIGEVEQVEQVGQSNQRYATLIVVKWVADKLDSPIVVCQTDVGYQTEVWSSTRVEITPHYTRIKDQETWVWLPPIITLWSMRIPHEFAAHNKLDEATIFYQRKLAQMSEFGMLRLPVDYPQAVASCRVFERLEGLLHRNALSDVVSTLRHLVHDGSRLPTSDLYSTCFAPTPNDALVLSLGYKHVYFKSRKGLLLYTDTFSGHVFSLDLLTEQTNDLGYIGNPQSFVSPCSKFVFLHNVACPYALQFDQDLQCTAFDAPIGQMSICDVFDSRDPARDSFFIVCIQVHTWLSTYLFDATNTKFGYLGMMVPGAVFSLSTKYLVAAWLDSNVFYMSCWRIVTHEEEEEEQEEEQQEQQEEEQQEEEQQEEEQQEEEQQELQEQQAKFRRLVRHEHTQVFPSMQGCLPSKVEHIGGDMFMCQASEKQVFVKPEVCNNATRFVFV